MKSPLCELKGERWMKICMCRGVQKGRGLIQREEVSPHCCPAIKDSGFTWNVLQWCKSGIMTMIFFWMRSLQHGLISLYLEMAGLGREGSGQCLHPAGIITRNLARISQRSQLGLLHSIFGACYQGKKHLALQGQAVRGL